MKKANTITIRQKIERMLEFGQNRSSSSSSSNTNNSSNIIKRRLLKTKKKMNCQQRAGKKESKKELIWLERRALEPAANLESCLNFSFS